MVYRGRQIVKRPSDKHVDAQELAALFPWPKRGEEPREISAEATRDAESHAAACPPCRTKVSEYQQLVNRLSQAAVSNATPPGVDCPKQEDVDWHEVAAGLWPEARASQLILHAALCDHCGPLLRAATSVDDDATPRENELLAQLKVPTRPRMQAKAEPAELFTTTESSWRRFFDWKPLVTAAALLVLAGVLSYRPSPTTPPVSGMAYAEFAVQVHKQYAQGILPLDVREESQQALNEWFKAKSPFPLELPAPETPGVELPYRLEGARLMQVGGAKTAAYIAYHMPSGPVSLVVTPASVSVASGGVEANFKKVNFHYRMVGGYKVVTWSIHDLTYALVSQEGNSTQRSCMVCHSTMKDRDLSETPAPLPANPALQ